MLCFGVWFGSKHFGAGSQVNPHFIYGWFPTELEMEKQRQNEQGSMLDLLMQVHLLSH